MTSKDPIDGKWQSQDSTLSFLPKNLVLCPWKLFGPQAPPQPPNLLPPSSTFVLMSDHTLFLRYSLLQVSTLCKDFNGSYLSTGYRLLS